MHRPLMKPGLGGVARLCTLPLLLTVGFGSPAWAQTAPKNTFNIMMNYELGMHCTGFEFAYCCVLPPYNSIVAQVVKTQRTTQSSTQGMYAKLLEGDPNVGKDVLGRETVLRDSDLNASNNFQKYVLRYWHDAQPRNDGRGKAQSSTLISAEEGNSLFMWSTVYDRAAKNPNGSLKTGTYDGATGVVIGNGTFDADDSYANGWMNHLYIYSDLEGSNPSNTTLESAKIRLGVDLVVPPDCGPSFQPMGPVTKVDPYNSGNPATKANDCGGNSRGNLLTFSGNTGTVVYTQMKVLENLPVTLTSPRIWEALGLPLTPFEDTINFFGDPGLVDEDSVRPYVQMKAQLHLYDPADTSTSDGDPAGTGAAVLVNGQPVIGLGAAPIDIPNCERCHSNPAASPNSPNTDPAVFSLVSQEYSFWTTFYNINTGAGDSDWYPRLKSAALSMMKLHDLHNGTSFTARYGASQLVIPPNKAVFPQNTRMGHESVICQKCHADNVIAAVKSASRNNAVIKPMSEAIHKRHRNTTETWAGVAGKVAFKDALNRDGGCQGCHPAHRSNGDMNGYPITIDGANFYASGDNRLGSGGCFVGRDVHSNPNKDTDGANTPQHLNAVGTWLSQNVFRNQQSQPGGTQAVRGIWCTNCHTQLGQEIWKKEDCADLVHSGTGTSSTCLVNPRGASSISALATALGTTQNQVLSWLDPKTSGSPDGVDNTHRVWDPATTDANLATIEVTTGGAPVTRTDADGDVMVNVLSFCTTADCITSINTNKTNPSLWKHPENGAVDGVAGFISTANTGAAVPFSAATDGRDHWLSAGEPHCADCHSAPYVEQSGNVNFFPPFNYPRKASLMRYSRGHRDITCQGCHESIHGLYPVGPVDTTSYAQAAGMNSDNSHGPLKCNACHFYNSSGVNSRVRNLQFNGTSISSNFDAAVGWQHAYTNEVGPRTAVGGASAYCQNCHGSETPSMSSDWLVHGERGRVSRKVMDQAESEVNGGYPFGAKPTDNPLTGVCVRCHGDSQSLVSCTNTKWKQHLPLARVAQAVWEKVSITKTGSTCGW